MKFNNYPAVLEYLYAQLPMFHRVGASAYKNNLDNTWALCTALNNPQNSFQSIHIAGTNGKGSTTHMIASILQEMGLKVGVYTSPHYIDFRERIKINGILISEESVMQFINSNQDLIERIQPSFFEATVAMAFDYFASEKVDIAVIEVGLGGRLDSTNVINPLVSVITNIGYDHMQFLGDTLPQIAAEKAGIIKNETPVVIGEHHLETDMVFENFALKNNSKLIYAEEVISLTNIHAETALVDLELSYVESLHFPIQFPLSAEYQLKNLKTATATIFELIQLDVVKSKIGELDISSCIQNGLKKLYENTYFIGRWMIIKDKPLVIFDSAHNEHGLSAIFNQVDKINFTKLHIVFGTVSDKDMSKVFPILPKKATYYLCKAAIPRAMDVNVLGELFRENAFTSRNFSSTKEAYQNALENANSDDLIIVAGSIFIVGELLEK